MIGDGVCHVRVADAAKGQLQVIAVDTDQEKPELKSMEVFVREAGPWMLLSIRDDEARDGVRYEWARGKIDADQLVVWLPDKDAFRTLVRDGKLKGRVEGSDVFFDTLSSADIAALAAGTLGVPFMWDEPLVFRRLPH